MSKKPNDQIDAPEGEGAKTAAPAPAAAKAPPALAPARLKQAEFERAVHRAILEAGRPFNDILRSSFWTHTAAKLRPFDKIEVLAEDGAFYGEAMVLSAGANYARVAALFCVDLGAAAGDAEAAAQAEVLEVDFAGPLAKHRVVRKSDRAVLRDGFQTRAEALAYAREHVKAA